RDVVGGAELHRVDGRFDRSVARHHDDRGAAGPSEELRARAARKADVGEHHVERPGGELGERVAHRLRLHHFVSVARHEAPELTPNDGFVLDEEEAGHEAASAGMAAGRRTLAVVPPPSVSISIEPPWSRTMPYATERPRPVPPSLVVTNGSKRRALTAGGTPPASSRTRTTTRSPSATLSIQTRCPGFDASLALRSRF